MLSDVKDNSLNIRFGEREEVAWEVGRAEWDGRPLRALEYVVRVAPGHLVVDPDGRGRALLREPVDRDPLEHFTRTSERGVHGPRRS